MGTKKTTGMDIHDVDELKKRILANAVATGNTYAYHDLFSRLKEFLPPAAKGDAIDVLMNHLAYLLPGDEMRNSPEYRTALELVERYEFEDDLIPAPMLEETAKRAIALGKFTYAEDAYRLLGIKKEIVGLCAQTGEHLLHDGKARCAAVAFHVAASLDQPIGPHYQYLGPRLHADCFDKPEKCVTALPNDPIINTGIRFLISNEPLVDRLMTAVRPDQKKDVLATLAVIRDTDFPGLMRNLREAVDAVGGIEDGRPDDYSPVGPALLGRTCGTDEWWQYLREFSFEHPLGALCVCVKMVKETPVIVPVIRDGKSIIESLVPPEYLAL